MSSRIRFFLGHLSLSILIALILIIVIFFIWYPFSLYKAVGVAHLIVLILTIDIILGPLLGFLVYKKGKKTLKFDLCVIIAIQVGALTYGLYSLIEGRPVWIVFHGERFELIRKNDVLVEKKEKIESRFQQPSWKGPSFVAVQQAKNKEQYNHDIFIEVIGGVSLAQYSSRYTALNKFKLKLKQNAKNIKELEQYNRKSDIQKILSKYPQATGWLPLKTNMLDMVVLINTENAKVVKIVDLRPWN